MPGFVGAKPSDRHGWPHQKARAAAFAALPEYSPCARCHHVMWKHTKDRLGRSALHYDHTDSNTGYLGFSHGIEPCPICGKRCNVKAGAAKGGRIATAKQRRRPRPWHSRHW